MLNESAYSAGLTIGCTATDFSPLYGSKPAREPGVNEHMKKFSQRNMASFVCGHVFRNERPILLVAHEEGDWQFLCGVGDDDFDSPDGLHVIGVGHLIDRDPSINLCSDLPDGFEAERSEIGAAWGRTKIGSEDH